MLTHNIWLMAILLFLVLALLVKLLMDVVYKKEYSAKMRSTWGARTYYWHFIIMIAGAATTMVIFFLKWRNIISF